MRRLAILLLTLLALPAAAQSWRQLGPDGGLFDRILVDANAPGRLYASGMKLWMSDDGGASWRQLPFVWSTTLVAAVTDPGEGNVIWLATGYRVFRSADAGRTFTLVYTDPNGINSMHFAGGAVYVGGGSGMASIENGIAYLQLTWTRSTTFATSPAATYAGTADQIWFTADHRSWQQTGTLGGARIVAADGDRVWRFNDGTKALMRSDDRGAHWTAAVWPAKTGTIAADATTHRLFAATADGLLASDDGGATWRTPAGAPPGAWTALSIESDRIAGTASLRVVSSTDGATTWHTADRGLVDGPVWSLAVDPETPELLAASTLSGLLRHDASGWGARYELDQLEVGGVVFDPATPRHAVAVACIGQRSFLAESADGGGTWSQGHDLQAGCLGNSGTTVAFDPWRRGALYVADPSGYITRMSSDGGTTWERFQPDGISSVSAVVATPQALFAATSNGLLRSTDRGGTWSAAAPVPVPEACRFAEGSQQGVVALATDGTVLLGLVANCLRRQLFTSSDGGVTWRAAHLAPSDPSVDYVAADPAHPGRFFAAAARDSWRSDDGGRTWQRLHPLPREAGWITALALSPDHLYAGTSDSGVWQLALDDSPPRRPAR